MKSIALAICILVATSVAAYPRSESDPSSNSQSHRSRENSYTSQNAINRINRQLLDRVPNAGNILSIPQEALAKRNADEIMSVLNDVYHVARSTESMKPTFAPSKRQIKVQLITRDGDSDFTLAEPERLLELPGFTAANEVVVFISGWKLSTAEEDSALNKLKEAYQCRGNVNFIHIDLGRLMTDLQTWLSLDIERVGEDISELLEVLIKRVPVDHIHIIAHSIAAQVAGEVGRKFKEATESTLPRITALDPPNLAYREKHAISGLHRGDAKFIDVIHTSSYGLGMPEPIGDVDFYPNGLTMLQPGTSDLLSAQNKAIEYYAETVLTGHEGDFMGVECNSIKNLHSTVCQQKRIPMGIATPTDAKGNFFLETKNMSPYGNNANPQALIRCRGY